MATMAEEEASDYTSDDESPLIGETITPTSFQRKHGVLTSNLFIVFVPVCFFAVLVVSHWLTHHSHHGIKSSAIFWCEIAILVLSIAAMTAFIIIDVKGKPHWKPLRPNRYEHRVQQSNLDGCCSKLPVREIIFVTFCLGSLVLLIFHTMGILYSAQPDLTYNDTLEIASHIMKLIFCLMQMLFVIHYRMYVLRNQVLRYLVALTVASDCCFFIKYIFFFVRQIRTNTTGDFPFFPIPHSHKKKPGLMTDLTDQFETYLFFFIVEYAVIAILFLVRLWVRTSFESGTMEMHGIESTTSSQESVPSSIGTRCGLIETCLFYLKITIRFVSYHSFYISAIACLAIVAMNLTLCVIGANHKKANGGYSDRTAKIYAEQVAIPLETFIEYASSGVSFASYILSRREQSVRSVKKSDKRLLLVMAFAMMILAMVETVESALEAINNADTDMGSLVMYCFLTFCRYVYLYCQVQTILKVSEMQVETPLTLHQLVLRGSCVYLGIFSVERWIELSFLTPVDLIQTNHLNKGFGVTTWWAILSSLYPYVCFYFIFSAIMFYEMLVRFPRS